MNFLRFLLFVFACCGTALSASAAPLNLVPSWNLLGNSVNVPITVATTFGNVANVTTVWKWNPATSRWAFYTPSLADGGAAFAASKGYDFLTVINGGEGFWVNAKAAFTAQLPAGVAYSTASYQDRLTPPNPLPAGWSLISVGDNATPVLFNSGIGLTPPAVGTIPSNLTTLWAWDSTLLNWYFYAPTLDANATLATYITSKNYLNFGAKVLDPVMGFWVNRPAPVVNPGILPIDTAKNMFTSLRTSLVQLTNPTRTGFFDTELKSAKTDLKVSLIPSINKTLSKLNVISDAANLMDNLRLGTANIPLCDAFFMFGICQQPDVAIAGNTLYLSVTFDPNTWVQSACNISLPMAFVSGALPVGSSVSCALPFFEMPTFTATAYTQYTFLMTVTPGLTVNDYSYSTMTQADTYDMLVQGLPVTTFSAPYIGTASVTKNVAGNMNNTLTVSGQFAANGITHAYDQVAISTLRTYLPGTPVGAPVGFALAKYDATGSISSVLASGVTTGSIALLAGTSYTQIEDVNGNSPALPADRNLGKALTVVMQARTANTQIDGTYSATNFVTDLSGTASLETNFTFTGSLTNLANPAVGKFVTGTLTDIRDYTTYDRTLPVTTTNRIKDTASFSGSVTNNTVAPAAVYQLTLNENSNVANTRNVSFTYRDPANNVVSASAFNINTTFGSLLPYPINITSGSVFGILTKAPSAGGANVNGLTGNLYVGGTPAAPGTLIGTLNGSMVHYSDGTFASLQ